MGCWNVLSKIALVCLSIYSSIACASAYSESNLKLLCVTVALITVSRVADNVSTNCAAQC